MLGDPEREVLFGQVVPLVLKIRQGQRAVVQPTLGEADRQLIAARLQAEIGGRL